MKQGICVLALQRKRHPHRKSSRSQTDHFNAHGDVVNLTNNTGAITKVYDYDAFGNEKNPDETDTNPFRYCGEYFDKETGTYYLRARYYDPAIGRFTQQDTHWNTSNMIYGDNPQKINEREDKLGLKTYSYAPQITTIMQAGNLYMYCGSNPLYYADVSGEVWETVFDVVSLCCSIAEVAANPVNVWSWLGLVGDAVDLIPFVGGIGEGIRALKLIANTADTVDVVTDAVMGILLLISANLQKAISEKTFRN